MMKKKPHLLFSAASPSSLSTIRAISEIRSFSYIVPSALSNNQSPPPPSPAPSPSLSTIRDIREIRSFSYKVPSSLSNNQSPPSPRVYRFSICPPLVQLVKFVVFQIKSPPPCQIISPLPPSSVSFLYVSIIRAISEIRSLSNTLPSFGGVGGGPLPPIECIVSVCVHHWCN